MTYKQLNYEERVQIDMLHRNGVSIRGIARLLERSPNTISRELREKRVLGRYTPKKAQQKTYRRRYLSKRSCMKVSRDPYLSWFVDTHIRLKWSPERMSGYLMFCGYQVSTKAIYRFVYRRSLDSFLIYHKRKRKQKRYRTQWLDGRRYIANRPQITISGHYEADFVVSSHNQYSLLVVVDKHTRYTKIERIPNRKHAMVTRAFQRIFKDTVVRSLTLDNDISFGHWKNLEKILDTSIYFTRPYASWEKGLVENTNRWIRLFVPKGSDIKSVTHADIQNALYYLNEIPRQCLNYHTALEVYTQCPS